MDGLRQCPDLEPIEREAVMFSNRVHHNAHAAYAGEVAKLAWPDIKPSENLGFLDLVATVWETRRIIEDEEAKKRRPSPQE